MKNKKVTVGIIGIVVILAVICLLVFLNNKQTYEVTFEFGNNNSNGIVEVEEDGTVVKPIDPTKEGYIFEGWYLNDEEFDFNTVITENITLTAKWTKVEGLEVSDEVKTYTVAFDTEGGNTISSQKIEEGKTVTKPANPTRAGYTFKGWYYNGASFDFNTKITKDVTLTAKWEKVENTQNTQNTQKPTKTYTVTFNTNGGSTVKAQAVEEGKTASKPAAPTRAGYTFKGWYLNGAEFDFATKITKDTTVTAKWEKIEQEPAKTYTVTFNSNGGSSVSSQTVEEGKTATEPTDPTLAGYTFSGWYLNDQPFEFATKIVSNITLVAKWQKNAVIRWEKEPTISDVGQVNIVVYKDNEKVDAVVDLVMNTGKVVTNIEIPKTGYTANTYKVVDVINIRVK